MSGLLYTHTRHTQQPYCINVQDLFYFNSCTVIHFLPHSCIVQFHYTETRWNFNHKKILDILDMCKCNFQHCSCFFFFLANHLIYLQTLSLIATYIAFKVYISMCGPWNSSPKFCTAKIKVHYQLSYRKTSILIFHTHKCALIKISSKCMYM